MKRSIAWAALLVFFLAVVVLAPLARSAGELVQDVLVTNFPKVQNIDGAVQLKGPVQLHNADLTSFPELTISANVLKDSTHLVEGGVIEARNHSEIVLSLVGLTKGDPTRPGTIGAILLPAEEPIDRAYSERGQLLFPLEIGANLNQGRSGWFSSNQARYTLGFSKYRLLLYNSTDKSVTVTVYANLIN